MELIKHLEKAKEGSYALAQFNFSTVEQLKGIVKAAKEKNVPVILGTSRGESEFLGLEEAVALRDVMRKDYPHIYLNLDHGKDLSWIEKAIEAGYDMIHFDGSDLNLDENIEKTKKVVEMVQGKNIVVEGEVGKVGGGSNMHKGAPKEQKNLTSTKNIAKFISETEVDLCAFSIGNVHGVYTEMPELDFDRLTKISKKTDVGLVMHGGSGISDEDIKTSITKGVVKVNVNTELRNVWRKEIERSFKENPDTVTPYKLFKDISTVTFNKAKEKINIFYENNF
ncbi:MAG: class II fructose-bisphosphate aldolase [Patescibacteria group bacterium]